MRILDLIKGFHKKSSKITTFLGHLLNAKLNKKSSKITTFFTLFT